MENTSNQKRQKTIISFLEYVHHGNKKKHYFRMTRETEEGDRASVTGTEYLY